MKSNVIRLQAGSVHQGTIEQALERLGLSESMMTDPAVVRDILENEMFLDDFDAFKTLLGDRLSKPQALGPLLQHMREGITEKHPAISEFLQAMLDRNLVPHIDDEARVCIRRTLHTTYLLDILIHEMAENLTFMVALRDHMLKKRGAYGIRAQGLANFWDILRALKNVFTAVKLVTMDKAFDSLLQARVAGQIEESSIKKRRNLLIINIMEAVAEDKRRGYSENSLTGVSLAINPMEQVQMTGGNRTIEYVLSQEWTSLYQTWNLAFLLGNIDNLHIVYPKLLIPQVLCAKANDYLYNRAIALWTVLNFLLFAKVLKKQDVKVPRNRELAKVWGEINLKYAQAFFEKVRGIELKGFAKLTSLLAAAIRFRKT